MDLATLPQSAPVDADYIVDYALLMFNRFTRGTVVHAHGNLSPAFWNAAKRVITQPALIHETTLIEHPYISDAEAAVVDTLHKAYPSLAANWYHVPRAVLH